MFVLRSGIQWELLPQDMGCGCGMTCWRRLRDWQVVGVWGRIWQAMLDELGVANEIDWSAAVIDSWSTRALFGGAKTGPNPTDHGKNGSKRYIIVDGFGDFRALLVIGPVRWPVESRIASRARWISSTKTRFDCWLLGCVGCVSVLACQFSRGSKLKRNPSSVCSVSVGSSSCRHSYK